MTDVRYAVGVDVGATNTKIGLVRAPGSLVEHQVILSQLQGSSAEPFLQSSGEVITAYQQAYPIEGIGVSLCSLINTEHTGASLAVNAPALNNFNIRQAFEERFSCPVRVCNDVVAHATAEYHFGAGRGARRMVCLALGTGVAAACIIDGATIETWGGVSADAARIILQPDAEVRCNGGVYGSAEALCGTLHIKRMAQSAYGRSAVTAREVISASHDGSDPIAAAVMAEIGRSVAHLLAVLSAVFFPLRIVITGGTAEAGEPFFQAVRSRYAELIGPYMASLARLESGSEQPVEIRKGELGPEAAVLGAAAQFLLPTHQLRMRDQ